MIAHNTDSAQDTENAQRRVDLFRRLGELQGTFKVDESFIRKHLILNADKPKSENVDTQKYRDSLDILMTDLSTCRQLRESIRVPFFEKLREDTKAVGKIFANNMMNTDMGEPSRIADPHTELLGIVEALSEKLPGEDTLVIQICFSHRLKTYLQRLKKERIEIFNDTEKVKIPVNAVERSCSISFKDAKEKPTTVANVLAGPDGAVFTNSRGEQYTISAADYATYDAKNRANDEAIGTVSSLLETPFLDSLIKSRVDAVLTPDRSKDLCYEVLALWSGVNEARKKAGLSWSGGFRSGWREFGDREYRERNGERVSKPETEPSRSAGWGSSA